MWCWMDETWLIMLTEDDDRWDSDGRLVRLVAIDGKAKEERHEYLFLLGLIDGKFMEERHEYRSRLEIYSSPDLMSSLKSAKLTETEYIRY